jgi:hypothetical protein
VAALGLLEEIWLGCFDVIKVKVCLNKLPRRWSTLSQGRNEIQAALSNMEPTLASQSAISHLEISCRVNHGHPTVLCHHTQSVPNSSKAEIFSALML